MDIISQFTTQYDSTLGQFVGELTVGTHRFATLMGKTTPTPHQLTETEKRLLATYSKPRKSNFVSATEGI